MQDDETVEMEEFPTEEEMEYTDMTPYFKKEDFQRDEEDDEEEDDDDEGASNPFIEKPMFVWWSRLISLWIDIIEHRGSDYWDLSVGQHVIARLPMLIALLVLQSASSFILEAFTDLLADHEVIVVYLTMLVGTGGNSGGQSAALVLQGLASGDIQTSDLPALLIKEGSTAIVLAFCIGFVGFLRAFIQFQMSSGGEDDPNVTVADCALIGVILFFIVIVSIIIGTCLPLFFSFLQELLSKHGAEQISLFLEPSNTTFPTFQVLMDILGITITVGIASLAYHLLSQD